MEQASSNLSKSGGLPQNQVGAPSLVQEVSGKTPLVSALKLLSQSLKYFKENALRLSGIYAVPVAFWIFISFFPGEGGFANLVNLINLILLGFANLAAIYAIKDSTSNVVESYKSALKSLWGYLWIVVLVFLVEVGGFMLFIVPGFIFAIWFSLSIFVFVFEEKRGFEAVLKSKDYVKGYFWPVAWRLLFLAAIALIGFYVLLLLVLVMPLMSMILSLLGSLLGLAYYPILIIYMVYLYGDLVRVKPAVYSSPTNTDKKGFFVFVAIMVILVFVLPIIVVLNLDPAQALKEARDESRITDLNAINDALGMYQADGNTAFGNVDTIYISLPDTSSTCASHSLPIPPSGFSYACQTEANHGKVDGTGWIPVNLTLTTAGSPLAVLPIDPTNTDTDTLYYTYVVGSYVITAFMESKKHKLTTAVEDGGTDSMRLEIGSRLSLVGLGGGERGGRGDHACGAVFTDSRDGKTYNTVLIGAQCWMAEHMNIGVRIAGAGNQANNATIEKYCYNDLEGNCTPDGGLYQWDEAMQYAASCNGTGAPPNDACASPVQGICPSGWHIPSHYELTTLEREVCNSGTCATDFPYDATTQGSRGTTEGTKLKPGGVSGFEGLLVGRRSTVGSFFDRDTYIYIWSSLESGSSAWNRFLDSDLATVSRHANSKLHGFSVRCLKD